LLDNVGLTDEYAICDTVSLRALRCCYDARVFSLGKNDSLSMVTGFLQYGI
jgi:hypothetical protein